MISQWYGTNETVETKTIVSFDAFIICDVGNRLFQR